MEKSDIKYDLHSERTAPAHVLHWFEFSVTFVEMNIDFIERIP